MLSIIKWYDCQGNEIEEMAVTNTAEKYLYWYSFFKKECDELPRVFMMKLADDGDSFVVMYSEKGDNHRRVYVRASLEKGVIYDSVKRVIA